MGFAYAISDDQIKLLIELIASKELKNHALKIQYFLRLCRI